MQLISKSFPTMFWLFILWVKFSQGFLQGGHEIKDLNTNNGVFLNDIQSWTTSGLRSGSSSAYTQCQSIYLLGGYQVLASWWIVKPTVPYFQRVYTSLPTHQTVYATFSVWMLDAWVLTDFVSVSFDSTSLNGFTFPLLSTTFGANACGGVANDYIFTKFYVKVPHSALTLTLRVFTTSQLDTSIASFGIRNVNLIFATSFGGSPATICVTGPTIFGTNQCICPEGQFQVILMCINCDASCASCYGGTSANCYQCKEGYFYDGAQCLQCTANCASCNSAAATSCIACKTGYILYTDGTCISSSLCVSPLITSNYGTLCQSPCPLNQFVYDDGTCSLTCLTSYVQGTMLGGVVKTCSYPCSTGQYLYWDNTCHGTCPSPLKPSVQGTNKFCEYPCSNMNFYYYLDGPCDASPCSGAYTQVSLSISGYTILTCIRACATSGYFYWNGNCIAACPSPLSKVTRNSIDFCESPCNVDQFVLSGTICLDSCTYPLIQSVGNGGIKFCSSPCPNALAPYSYWDGSCQDVCPSGYFANGVTALCQECQVANCANCPSTSSKRCLECESGNILDLTGDCKGCDSLSAEYVMPISLGHQYKLRLLPGTCDLTESSVQSKLRGSDKAKALFASFSFEVTKLGANLYQVNLILTETIMNTQNLDIELEYLSGTLSVPRKIVPDATLQAIAAAVPLIKNVLSATVGASVLGTGLAGATASLWSIINFQQFVGYFIYLNIDYPYQVEVFLSLFQSISWHIIPNPLEKLTRSMKAKADEIIQASDGLRKQLQPPKKFVQYDQTSFFIDNAGSIFAVNASLLVLLLLIIGLTKIPSLKQNRLLNAIKNYMRWNVILRILLENGVPLAMSIFLQVRVFSYSNLYFGACTTLALVSSLFILILLGFSLSKLLRSSNESLNSQEARGRYGTLYEGMTLKDLSKYYNVIILLRGIVLVLLLTLADNYILFQVTPLIYINLALIYFLCKTQVFEQSKLNTINRIKEVLILLSEFCIILLKVETDSEKYYQILGWLIVGFLMSALLIELVYSLVVQIISMVQFVRKIPTHCRSCRQWIKQKFGKQKGLQRVRNFSRPGVEIVL